MATNSFGQIFRITTFGESHGPAIGVVIGGCPAGLPIIVEDINRDLALRQPGTSSYVTPRSEPDEAQILSGIFEGKTTGAPIAIVIFSRDADSSKYEPIKDLLRPGHANFTYLEKYGIFDYRGGGRSSARETAARVAAGAVAKKLLAKHNILPCAYLCQLGPVACPPFSFSDLTSLRSKALKSPLFCPDPIAEKEMIQALDVIKKEGDSLGGIVQGVAINLPAGLGDPVYGKLEALLASAMLSIPASKGFEIGSGFAAARMKGSEHNDSFDFDANKQIRPASNEAGGTLGGISTGAPLLFRVPFKPTSSIQKPQKTRTLSGQEALFELPKGSRHDPCVAIRAVPVVEAMLALVLADALLMNRLAKA